MQGGNRNADILVSVYLKPNIPVGTPAKMVNARCNN